MFKNEVTHTTSCREASPGTAALPPGLFTGSGTDNARLVAAFCPGPVRPPTKAGPTLAEPVTSTQGSALHC